MTGRTRPTSDDRTVPGERLESWKEIAAYLRRGVRTVRRWEKEEALPVHRHLHKKRGTVYAHGSELDVWRDGRRRETAGPTHAVRHRSPNVNARLLIAVLPFENLSGDSRQQYFADGLTEEMISQLGRLSPDTLGVIARTSVTQFKERNAPIRQIADELKVDYLVEGSVRHEADRVRVTAQLVSGLDQTHLWAGCYEQPMRSVMDLQRELAEDIGREIHIKLSPERLGAIGGAKAVNPDAYKAHLKGRYLLNECRPESVRRSVELFQRAIDRDPTYAPAFASLAEAYEQLPMWADAPSGQTLPLALDAAARALRLDPTLPEAYVSLGLIHAYYQWDWPKAETYFQRALELNPSCSPARQFSAEFAAEMGRIDEALALLEPAMTHDPLSRGIHATRSFVLGLGRRFDEAIAQAELALELDRTYPMSLIRLAVACEGKGMHAGAVRALRLAERSAPGLLDCASLLGFVHGRAGNRREALGQLDKLRRAAKRRYVPPFLFANVHLGLGEQEEALGCMEREYDSRGWYLLLIRQAYQFDPLRGHPRFDALVERMRFPD